MSFQCSERFGGWVKWGRNPFSFIFFGVRRGRPVGGTEWPQAVLQMTCYDMVETVTGPVHAVTNTYESSRNVLSLKENEVGSTLISSYDYTVNNFGQRTQLATDGSAFSVQPALVWGYNSHGELIEASDSSSSNFDRAYEYDAIGNHQKTVNGLIGDLPTNPNCAANALMYNKYLLNSRSEKFI